MESELNTNKKIVLLIENITTVLRDYLKQSSKGDKIEDLDQEIILKSLTYVLTSQSVFFEVSLDNLLMLIKGIHGFSSERKKEFDESKECSTPNCKRCKND